MRRTRILATVALFIALAAGASACSPAADEPAGAPTGSGAPPSAETTASGAKITPGDLPTEPGTSWTVAHYQGQSPTPLPFTVAGPWTITAGPDWRTTTDTIVDPATVPGIDAFSGYDHVVKGASNGGDIYYVRQMTDEWMLQLGEIQVRSGVASPQPSPEPVNFWPMNFAVGDVDIVSETDEYKLESVVLAQNTATVPAGTIEDAYLLRFTYTSKKPGVQPTVFYYLLAPKVGFVALLRFGEGTEATGFTSAFQIDVLATPPVKR